MAEEFEPHIRELTVGSYTDLWHRFRKPRRHPKFGVYLTTRCGQEIYDHYNVRSVYNTRIDRFCGKCFPYGITSEGRAKPSPRDARAADAANAEGDGSATGQKSDGTEGSQSLTSTPEPLVSEPDDAGDGGATPEEGSGVLGAGDDGHVEELPEGREPGDSTVEGGDDQEGGQGKSGGEPSKGRKERPAGERKPKDNTSR